MKTITHEGLEYILKTDVDGIVQSRLSKITESKRMGESKVLELEGRLAQMTKSIDGVESLRTKITELESSLKTANQKYNRHSAITQSGITNPEVRDLVEWQYTKSMDALPKKDRVSMGHWLSSIQESGQVPKLLAPYLSQPNSGTIEAGTPEQLSSLAQAQAQPVPAQPVPAQPIHAQRVPATNAGVQPSHGTNASILERASDYQFFKANRQKIKEAYYAKRGNVWQK